MRQPSDKRANIISLQGEKYDRPTEAAGYTSGRDRYVGKPYDVFSSALASCHCTLVFVDFLSS